MKLAPSTGKEWVRAIAIGAFALVGALLLLQLFSRTAQKGTATQRRAKAKLVGMALGMHYEKHGSWPATLGLIDPSFGLSPEMLTYPALDQLPVDGRNMPDEYPTVGWLYFPPTAGEPSLIILASPLPFYNSEGAMLRIVVRADNSVESIKETVFGEEIAKRYRGQQ